MNDNEVSEIEVPVVPAAPTNGTKLVVVQRTGDDFILHKYVGNKHTSQVEFKLEEEHPIEVLLEVIEEFRSE